MIDDPAGEYYGSEIAAPVFQEMMSQVMRQLNIFPQIGMESVPPANQPVKRPDVSAVTPRPVFVPPGKVLIPNFTGKTMREVGDVLNKLDLSFIPVGTGVAVQQSIAQDTIVEPGTEVTVYFEAK